MLENNKVKEGSCVIVTVPQHESNVIKYENEEYMERIPHCIAPTIWKIGEMIMIPKPGKSAKPSSLIASDNIQTLRKLNHQFVFRDRHSTISLYH